MKSDQDKIIEALNIAENTLSVLAKKSNGYCPQWLRKNLQKDKIKVSKARQIAEELWP